MSLQYKEIVYHGTVSEITKIDVSYGRRNKDFGQGFYMATSKQQAIGMMHKKYREMLSRNRNKKPMDYHENLYEIILDLDYMRTLNIKVFDSANTEWLDFVLTCRKHNTTSHDYDMVIGPTADDNTMLCLKAYYDGLYGPVGSPNAQRILLDNLEPENLGIQYFVGKQEIADKLVKDMHLIHWR